MTKPVYYFDYMATTPIDPRVIKKMLSYMGLDGVFGNPSSQSHVYGREAAEAVAYARAQIATVIGAEPQDLIFTSGATASNQLALFGSARLYHRKGRHLITMKTEHPSVLGPLEQLQREGFEVSFLTPQPDGLLDMAKLAKTLRPDTILLSIMHVNNETGVIQPIAEIGELIKGRGIVFHVDAAQSVGKISVKVDTLGVDLMTLSAHKNYGPKGVGALYIRSRPRVRVLPLSFGGGQERGLSPGTLPTHQIVGMGEAFALGEGAYQKESARIMQYRDKLWAGLKTMQGVRLNGHPTARIAGILNVSIDDISSDQLLPAMPGLAVSSASACATELHHPSYVLKAMGLSDVLAQHAIRFSLGRFTEEDEVDAAITIFQQAIALLRSRS